MRDRFEELLADRLTEVADTVPDGVAPPADLEWRVARFRRREHRWIRLGALGVAAALVTAVAIVSVLARAPARHSVGIQSPPDAVSKIGQLKPNVAMLDARGRYVVALDAAGHQVDTLVVTAPGRRIVDVQVTSDHQELWYLSVAADAPAECGHVVRADIGTGHSEIVADANAFAIDADGRSLAYTGPCRRLAGPSEATTTIRDLGTGAEEVHRGEVDVQLNFTPDGRSLLTRTCSRLTNCGQIAQAPLHSAQQRRGESFFTFAGSSAPFAVAPEGLYVVGRESNTIEVRTIGALDHDKVLLRVGQIWGLEQVLPTRFGVLVVATHGKEPPALYRIVGNRLVFVRTYEPGELGNLTPVLPIG